MSDTVTIGGGFPPSGAPDPGGAGGGTPSPDPAGGSQPPQSGGQGEAGDVTRTWPKEIQAEFTRRTQEWANEKRAWEQERQSHQQQQQQWQSQQRAYLQALYRVLTQRGQGAGAPGQSGQPPSGAAPADPFANVRDLPYVDGQTLAQSLHQIQQAYAAGVQPVQQDLQRVMQGLSLLTQQNQQLRQQVDGIVGTQRTEGFESRIRQVREQFKLPDVPEVYEVLKDIYLSYEPGPDLDREFPTLVQQRWDALRKAVREADRREAEEARRRPFPTRGGTASPSGPLQEEFKPITEVAKEMWQHFNSRPAT